MSFSFLLGVLACCISAFPIVNRFGFALNGAACAFDRIYYDALYGQLKEKGERWEGLDNTRDTLEEIQNFFCEYVYKESSNINYKDILKLLCDRTNELKEAIPESKNFKENIKEQIKFEYFHNKHDTLYASLKVLSMVYYCLLLIAVTAAGVSMMFYACLKRQGYLITFMHVLWNVIRFFMLSFFLIGTAYGIFFLILKDLIFCMNQLFDNYLIEDGKSQSKFLHDCLFLEKKKFLDEIIKTYIIYFFTSEKEISVRTSVCQNIQEDEKNKCNSLKQILEYKVDKGILGSFDCSFLKSDLNHLYKTLYDASVQSRYLSALSLCSSFFGAVSVYFYLLVIHHYNNELFFDSGKSIFTGFDGFGSGFKKKNQYQDPAYKKRKIRAEIELTSKNEEENP